MTYRAWISSSLLLIMVAAATGVSLAAWKFGSSPNIIAGSATQPEVESVMVTVAREVEERPATGSSVRGRAPVASSRRSVAVPVRALLKGSNGYQVFVIEPDKDGRPRAHVRQVERGPIFGDEAVIHAGLSSGERVATSGAFRLRNEVLVTIANRSEGDR